MKNLIVDTLNRATLIAYVCSDPQLGETKKGNTIANFVVATNTRWKTPEGEQMEQSEYHEIAVSDGNYRDYVMKNVWPGCIVYIEGELFTYIKNMPDGRSFKNIKISIQRGKGRITLLHQSKQKEKQDDR